MQYDCEENGQSCGRPVILRLRCHGCGKCDSIDQRVYTQTKTESCPGKIGTASLYGTLMVRFVTASVTAYFIFMMFDVKVVLMKMEGSNHKEHEQQTDKAYTEGNRRVSQHINRMWQQIKKCNSKHYSRYETENQLRTAMR